jgi:uncharacterized membrane protein
MNLGDSMVLLCGLFFGPWLGFVTGGVGSMLADIIGGYAQWAPWTLAIKGTEAAIAALLFKLLKAPRGKVSFRLGLSFLLAVAWMVLGYFGAECLMYDPKAALVEVPANLIQAGGSLVLACLLYPLFERVAASRGRA